MEKKKFVYEDGDRNKVIKGYILKEDEYTYKIEAERTKAIIILGKRAIVKIDTIEEGGY